ncbi:hypothetical protein OCU04_010784 [Sclerotinia nivalis]|uniref:Uncharacterized protein n=1 Tax=Sclerotinia nivalis TaxID=352851 RepID=A0A9X0ACY1_9HELO|nr:hypothetical protein OCU04_010784 [Sclerotinia nivalis]
MRQLACSAKSILSFLVALSLRAVRYIYTGEWGKLLAGCGVYEIVGATVSSFRDSLIRFPIYRPNLKRAGKSRVWEEIEAQKLTVSPSWYDERARLHYLRSA